MKKIFILLVAFLSIFSFYYFIFAQETEGTLSVDKQNYLLTDIKQCFTFSFPNEVIPAGTKFDIQFFSFGPNNRGCQNGCTVQATRYLWYSNTGTFCLDNPFSSNDDAGDWSAYVIYNNKKTNSANYKVQSNLSFSNNNSNSTSSNITLNFTANGAENISVAPGSSIRYEWWTDVNLYNSDLRLDSWYTANKPDTCSGGIIYANQVKPWVAYNYNDYTYYSSGVIDSKVESCQEGVTYTITLAIKNINTNTIIKSKSITVNVISKNQEGNYIPLDFCSKFENGKTYTFSEVQDIFRQYYDNDKKSCDLQMKKYYVNGNLNLDDPSIPYSPNGDGRGIAPGVFYKADFYFTLPIRDNSGRIVKVDRTKRGYVGLCNHFDNDLFSFLGFGPGAQCADWSGIPMYCEIEMYKDMKCSTLSDGILRGPLTYHFNYCVRGDQIMAVKDSIKKYCNKDINIQSNFQYSITQQTSSIQTSSPFQFFTTQISQTSTIQYQQNNKFDPLNTDFYTGPLKLSYEYLNSNQKNNQNLNNQTNNIQNQNLNQNINTFSSSKLLILSSVLEKLTEIIESSSKLPSEAQSKIVDSIKLLISVINDILNKIKSSLIIVNNNQQLSS